MRHLQFDRLLAGTALALALTLTAQPALAQSPAQTVAGVPVPNTDQLPPISLSDVTPAAPAAKPAETAAPAAPAAAEIKPVIAATSVDDMISEKLRDYVDRRLERIITRKNERSAAENFYRDRKYAPLWISDGRANDRAKAAIGYLKAVDRDGLDPADYPAPDFAAAGSDPDALAEADVKLTAAVLTYARHAANGRVHFSRVAADVYYNHAVLEPREALAQLSDSRDVAATLDSFEPQQPGYKALKKALADARNGGGKAEPEKKVEEKPHVKVPEGKILRPGMKDQRVVALRKRLNIAGDKESTLYDDAVRDSVKAFQTGADLNADGNLGPNTVRAMNGAPASASAHVKLGDPVDIIIANLDRWRWLPRNLGSTHVIVNIPDYRLTVYRNDKTVWTTKIVVGKPHLPTPIISAEMKFITVNPTWNVPPSIVEKEYLPALQEDPQALERIGLKVTQDADGTVHIHQPPGAGNALGRIRFNFPNKFLVYQHDTPDKYLFARDKRAYSHGCMRVENPLKYGEVLLSLVLPEEHYTAARLEKMFGGSEININFPTSKFIAVHLTYQTAFVDEDGKLQLREDIYGRDSRMIAALKGGERKVADIAIERSANSSAKPVKLAPGTFGGGGPRGPGFLDWLFNDNPRAPPPQRGRGGRVSAR